MNDASIWQQLLGAEPTRSLVSRVTAHDVAASLGVSSQVPQITSKEWKRLLLVASALTSESAEESQDAVLRIAQACLASDSATESQKRASTLLLRRLGNEPAAKLAESRNLVGPGSPGDLPLLLALDAAARSRELTISTAMHAELRVNDFQRSFWDLVETQSRVSVSAPTSAGKSFIVREWIVDEIRSRRARHCIYIAPTRALVEEVAREFRSLLPSSIGVHTLPWDHDIAAHPAQIFVLTQERLHVLQSRAPELRPDILFVDEAQKIGDGSRGVLLTQVIDESLRRNPEVRVVFASPLSRNPEVLIQSSGVSNNEGALVGRTVTVNQNVVYASAVSRHPKQYAMDLVVGDQEVRLGTVEVAATPTSTGQRVPLLAHAIAGSQGGNLIFANGPAEAEKYARVLFELVGDSSESNSEALEDLAEFAEGVVHPKFPLAEFARRGIAFHYGPMPLVLKSRVERLFASGEIKFLIATSTLLEGVNLPCRNIVIRAPRKGKAGPMPSSDFWNLAGRAGRWGLEFQGNVVCVDVNDEKAWPEKPGRRTRTQIAPAAATTLRDISGIQRYIASGARPDDADATSEYESVFSWLTGNLLAYGTLEGTYGADLGEQGQSTLKRSISSALAGLTLDPQIVRRHAGISPLSMQRLYTDVLEHGRPDELTLVSPSSQDAFDEYQRALELVDAHLGGPFSPHTRLLQLSRLVVNWMRGVPVSLIIEGKAKYRREKGQDVSYPQLIREVLVDIENVARYEAPKLLACYSDVVLHAAGKLNRIPPEQVDDVELMLELGVPRRTDMSLMSLGLSRSTTRSIADFIALDNMTPEACADWIVNTDPERLDLPRFAIRELAECRRSVLDRRNLADKQTDGESQ